MRKKGQEGKVYYGDFHFGGKFRLDLFTNVTNISSNFYMHVALQNELTYGIKIKIDRHCIRIYCIRLFLEFMMASIAPISYHDIMTNMPVGK